MRSTWIEDLIEPDPRVPTGRARIVLFDGDENRPLAARAAIGGQLAVVDVSIVAVCARGHEVATKPMAKEPPYVAMYVGAHFPGRLRIDEPAPGSVPSSREERR